MIKIGMILGDRYEIIEKIGTGGMSDVYKARDEKLNRNVAVKVLKQEFGDNENFVSKFRVEAQAAAGLMHPNIVNVYDVGEEADGIHYIVMELVEGITLKRYIEKKARLTYKEAISIAIQVSLGIEAAHNNHIIHRDIKPQNIIISKDGKVKVTDFGIAKAATSNTISSNVMGSVHYTSPEQARGGYSDEKSDIYSLGITMYEMLTGRVPFNGETTVAIAIKHIQEDITSPREYVPEIPCSVESIVLKCCEKSPDRRYQSMHELIDDLKQSLLNPDADFVTRVDPDMEGGTRIVTDDEVRQVKRGTNSYIPEEEAYYEDENEENWDEEVYEEDNGEEEGMRLAHDNRGYYEGEDGEGEEEEDVFDAKMERITTIMAIVAGIVIVLIIIVLAYKLLGKKPSTPNPGTDPSVQTPITSPVIVDEDPAQTGEGDGGSNVPAEGTEIQQPEELVSMIAVAGMKVDDARNAVLALGLYPALAYEESDTVESGLVIRCDTPEGTQVKPNATITLVISSGASGVEIPNVSGKTYEDAYNMLTQKGFMVNKVESSSETIPEGMVISQNPAATTKAPSGSVVTVTISSGKEDTKVRVPNLVGLAEEAAVAEAKANGLSIGEITYIHSNEYETGKVCTQSIAYGTYVEQGSKINLQVSLGAGAITYKYNASITAPTAEEAPFYTSGMDVHVKLVTNDGTILLDTTFNSFPQAANYFNLSSSGGIMTMSFSYFTDATTTTDADGNEVVVPGDIVTTSFDRVIVFTPEE